MLDRENTITPLQSGTIRAALKTILFNAVTILAVLTGKTFDIDAINNAVDYGVPVLINLYSMWLGWKAYKGRMSATKAIQPKTITPT